MFTWTKNIKKSSYDNWDFQVIIRNEWNHVYGFMPHTFPLPTSVALKIFEQLSHDLLCLLFINVRLMFFSSQTLSSSLPVYNSRCWACRWICSALQTGLSRVLQISDFHKFTFITFSGLCLLSPMFQEPITWFVLIICMLCEMSVLLDCCLGSHSPCCCCCCFRSFSLLTIFPLFETSKFSPWR